MDYSVYIIQDRTKTNQQLFEELAGDTGLGEHLKNAGAGAVADALGANILDRYATTEKLGENGIAIRNEMINSVSIKSESNKKETLDFGSTQVTFRVLRTITVTGNLFAPSLIEMKSKTVKNKDMAKVMAWANLAPTPLQNGYTGREYSQSVDPKAEEIKLRPEMQIEYALNDKYPEYYYRRVLITIYSDKDTQFRAILHDKVYVSSYTEEYTDKDGNGKFTLVMQSIAANVFDVIVAGPTYKWSALAIADQISTAAGQVTKATNKGVETFDKVTGKNISKDVEEYTKKVDNANDGLKYVTKDDITIDTVGDNVQKQAENWHPTDMEDAIDQANEYKEAYDGLTDEQKATLKNIPGFDNLSTEEKMKYIEKLKDVVPTKTVQDMIADAADHKKQVEGYNEFYSKLTDDQKGTLANIPGFDSMDVDKKMEFLKTIVAGSKVPGVETMESLQAITDIARKLLGNSTDKK